MDLIQNLQQVDQIVDILDDLYDKVVLVDGDSKDVIKGIIYEKFHGTFIWDMLK